MKLLPPILQEFRDNNLHILHQALNFLYFNFYKMVVHPTPHLHYLHKVKFKYNKTIIPKHDRVLKKDGHLFKKHGHLLHVNKFRV